MYAMTNTCLGFAFPIGQVAQFIANLAPLHWTIVKHIFCYIEATKNMGILYIKAKVVSVFVCVTRRSVF
jgi:hypothetical protein